ncbi:DNA-directed DNA polymerase gamma mip1 [Coemansia sp. RSA 1813]|nr:DNA-directed DNA polymerase gamma mip1 [Coemansia sp. RSA 1646]KAJ1767920.1 DNA-directed DNA polymerase gamma mip1 [Coemansia sp. RSA 1843]KAJ2086492.1 DNA-directed DNA polymerase gamma mip1 [Coemansia sp. RSA 986]KAJ2213500.1 DNA-directed DNA polymerase gamma mip1 [Coemansia sp. RSA 487]KAJ2564840.1 DNA-directed DNA polymerase gamma mip1 [Coemansia sp. RSA 1813]
MLAPQLRKSVFAKPSFEPATDMQKRISIDHLKSQEVYGKESEPVEMADFTPPKLVGSSIDEHFRNIGEIVAEPYLSMAKRFAAIPDDKMPKMPSANKWLNRSGWTRYGPDGETRKVVAPDAEDDVLVYDVEILVPDAPYPIMAAAVSPNAWYMWVSPYLTGDSSRNRHLIPMMHPGQRKPRLTIGHNVGFDRARIQEERLAKRPPLGFLDTMSLHVSSGGLCSQQRLYWMRYSRAKKENDKEYLQLNADTGKFFDVSSLNSLKEVARHYCSIDVDKAQRDMFVVGSLKDICENFAALAEYCAMDVDVTRKVYTKVFPAFLKKCPHPVSFAGMVTMLEGYLPVDRSWPEYICKSEELLKELSGAVTSKLRDLAEDALKSESPMDDPWLRNLDWTVEPQKFTKPKFKADGSYAKNGEPRPYTKQLLPGFPQWYRDIWDKKFKRPHITVRTRIAPYLLKLKWLGYPLYHSSMYGWAFRVPINDYNMSINNESADLQLPSFKGMRVLEFPSNPDDPEYEKIPAEDSNRAFYFKVPHPDGESANCGNPFAKSYQTAIEDGTLSSAYPMAKQAMEMNAMCSYWISARERIKSQFVVWDGDAEDAFTGKPLGLGLPESDDSDTNSESGPAGVILPIVVPMGTITRRAVESAWMTASNAKANRLGSELKSMVRCPKGYRFVGADVDSEELWISALIGDSQFRMHGATAFGWMTLQGTKAEETDLHSNTARILDIGRGSAKVFNYGRIYGAGVKYATTLLLQFNPDMTEAEAVEKAEQLYASTKGKNMRNKRAFGRAFWYGGTESYMFNKLEAIATSDDPRTPALGCGIADALKKNVAGDRFMTSRVNWVVQSSGVDYLHLLLVSMTYLSRCYNIDMRFVISVHDEVRYMVSERDVPRAALALQISNLWVRSLFSYRLGMEDLPQSVAFFSAVDVDHVLRKEVDMECITPTNPTPIPPGVSYSIKNILDLTNGGSLDPPQNSDSTDQPTSLVDHSLFPILKNVKVQKPKNSRAMELLPSMYENKPDYLWLTAQMLSSSTEINALLVETQHAMKKYRYSHPAAKHYKKTAGYTETRCVQNNSK